MRCNISRCNISRCIIRYVYSNSHITFRRSFSDLMQARLTVFAQMYIQMRDANAKQTCSFVRARVPPERCVKEFNKREPGKLQGPLTVRCYPLFLSPFSSLHPELDEDSSRTKFQRLWPLLPEIIRSLSSHFSPSTSARREENGKGCCRVAVSRKITCVDPDPYDRFEP